MISFIYIYHPQHTHDYFQHINVNGLVLNSSTMKIYCRDLCNCDLTDTSCLNRFGVLGEIGQSYFII